MPLSITNITVELQGTVAPDITSLEIDGVDVTIASNRSWAHQVTVPPTSTTVAVTAIAPKRRETRMVEIGSGAAPAAPG
jgi:ribosomal protein L11